MQLGSIYAKRLGRAIILGLPIAVILVWWSFQTWNGEPDVMVSLTYLNRFEIEDRDAGLLEPSGLALARDGEGLWTVSDDTESVFQLGVDGKVRPGRTLEVPDQGLEGITLDRTGEFLLAVREESNEIFKLDLEARGRAGRFPLDKMDGYGAVAPLFADSAGKNKGLEGITWNGDTGTFFVLKEGEPGLLIELSEDLGTILSHVRLGGENGFVDPDEPDREVDYSGLCHDPLRSLLWIVSDKAERLYLYGLGQNRVVQSLALNYLEDGAERRIKKAEGLAYDHGAGRLYVVSDKEARLYVYDVRP